MANALEIDGEEDVSLLGDLGQSFGLRFPAAETIRWATVGDIYRYLLKHRRSADPGDRRCASAMAFFRLRRCLEALAPAQKLSPSTRVGGLGRISTKKLYALIERETELVLPKRRASWLGILAIIVGLIGIFVAPAVVVIWHLGLGLPLLLPLTAVVLQFLDPGQFPRDCQTLGGLATRTALLNFDSLVGQGARAGDKEVWNALTGILADYSVLLPSEMRPESFLLRARRRA